MAELYLAANEGMPRPAPKMRLSDWSPEVAELRVVTERLALVASAVAAASKAQLPRLPDRPRPVTASDRLRLRRQSERHRRLVSQLIPTEEA